MFESETENNKKGNLKSEEINSDESENKKFSKIITDFTIDVLHSFPEFKDNLNEHLQNLINNTDNDELTSTNYLFDYCKQNYPEKFFDILYQKNELFEKEGVFFLPDIDFHFIWQSDISDKTRETIWKYLQLLLFTLVTDIDDTKSFGDTAKLFESINHDEFKTKLEDTIKDMHDLFDSKDVSGNDSENKNMNLPNADEMHEHITGMLDGKLGQLAREIAEETAEELDLDLNESSDVNDVYEKLFKNPTKLMGLVKNVGSKLDSKIKSGDIKEGELMEEATDLMKKMKDMPGMDNIQGMLNKMGMDSNGLKEMMKGMDGNGLQEMMKGMGGKAMKGKAGQANMNNFTNMMEKSMNDSKRREKILEKLEEKKREEEEKLKQQLARQNDPLLEAARLKATAELEELLDKEETNNKKTTKSTNAKKKKKKNKK
mgnify:CR=1 FL=1